MKLVFDERAAADLDSIFVWLAQDSRITAELVMDRLFSSAEMLTVFPSMGHPGRFPGTREWVVPRLPYVLVYEIDQKRDRIVIAAIFHTAQDRDRE
ncbi:type II toxin-antitoxin system RelE/ParE family toxin [Rhodopseudomonas sp. RCAM05734]|uniref:type II toxin-antitoxin system RelE/ParE family toxin n=1 Tax=Rhodopseudomonas sp. RCAM05734 TaxID=3457549 RepID=UPI0040447F84